MLKIGNKVKIIGPLFQDKIGYIISFDVDSLFSWQVQFNNALFNTCNFEEKELEIILVNCPEYLK